MREVLSPSCTCKSRLPSKRSLGYLVPEGSLEVGMRGGNGACEAWDVAATVALSGSSWAPSLWVTVFSKVGKTYSFMYDFYERTRTTSYLTHIDSFFYGTYNSIVVVL
ncbi:hypothetical protein ACOSQ2_028504 [Xanthoceras sorbifolium]